jgi:hypothetical protein
MGSSERQWKRSFLTRQSKSSGLRRFRSLVNPELGLPGQVSDLRAVSQRRRAHELAEDQESDVLAKWPAVGNCSSSVVVLRVVCLEAVLLLRYSRYSIRSALVRWRIRRNLNRSTLGDQSLSILNRFSGPRAGATLEQPSSVWHSMDGRFFTNSCC